MTIRPILLGASAAITMMAPVSSAMAQDADVLVMRRAIEKPKGQVAPGGANALKPVAGSDLNGFYWVVSDWLRGEPACTATKEQTRLRGCVYQGQQANDANCPQPAPEKTRLVEDYRSCSHQWVTTPSGPWAETCAQTTRPVSAECQRPDGTVVEDSLCTGAKPTSIAGYNEEGCTYSWGIGDWGNWKSGCSAETTRDRKVECKRSNGSIAPDPLCEEPKPDTSETGENYSNCSYRWTPSDWKSQTQSCGGEVRQTRTVTCRRTDGLEGDASLCLDPVPSLERTAPDFGVCSYAWIEGQWGEWSSQCSTKSVRRRSVQCQREDGEFVDSSNCGGTRPDTEQTEEILTGCSYAWNTGEWTTVPQCSASAESTRSVTCRRTDGRIVEDSLCGSTPRPASSKATEDYAGCTYGWSTGTYSWDSTCSDSATGTRSVTCRRSDGSTVPDQQCVLSDKPTGSITQVNHDGCPASWVQGEWTDWDSQCSNIAKRTRTVQCVQQQPTQTVQVGTEKCDQARPPSAETLAIYSGCVAQWTPGNWGWNGVVGAKSSQCSSAPKQERTATCTNRTAPDGEYRTVDASQCTGTKPELQQTLNPDYSACTYEWNPGPWGDWDSLCSATAKRTRTTQCIRKDGSNTPSAFSFCDSNAEGAKTVDIQEVVIDCGGKLKNSGFEEGFAEWQSGYYEKISSDSYSGTKAASIGDGISQTSALDANPAQTITINMMCKNSTSGIYSSSAYIHIQANSPGMSGKYWNFECERGGIYKPYTFSFKPNVTINNLTIKIYTNNTSSRNKALIDDVIVTVK